MKIALTGGHFTPCYSVWEELTKRDPKLQVLFFGRKHALSNDKTLSLEYSTFRNKNNLLFINLITGKLHRYFCFDNFLLPVKFLTGFLQSFYYLITKRPDIIISFGGYLSVPVVLAGWMLRIPIISHEQTLGMGLATKINSHLSNIICVSFEKSLQYFPKNKTILTGNPIRKSIINAIIPEEFKKYQKFNLPIIFVTGGNLGSHFINNLIADNLLALLKSYVVVHQCGSAYNNRDLLMLNKIKDKLPENLQERYFLTSNINPEDTGGMYKLASLVISRSGINTTCELLYLKKPSILIPLPIAAKNEQEENAKLLADAGFGRIILQEQASGKILINEINNLLSSNKTTAQKNNIDVKIFEIAAKKIVEQIEQIYGEKKIH